jgi:hypothetical protein
MHAPVLPQIQSLDRRPGNGPRRRLVDEREHRPVVMRIPVHVQQVPAHGRGDGVHQRGPGALADVDHTLQLMGG